MLGSKAPATIVICAAVRTTLPTGSERMLRGLPVVMTWIAPVESIEVAAALASGRAGCGVALELEASAFESRQRLRTLLARGREAQPDLVAVAIRGGTPPGHRDVLVEEGIRVALVESLAAAGRGSRRPAPSGWRCRNAAWGLWEVEADRPRGWAGWFGIDRLTRPRAGTLRVISGEGLAGPRGSPQLAGRLQRWLAWAGRQVARGTAEAASLPRLAARLGGEDQASPIRSVLKAA